MAARRKKRTAAEISRAKVMHERRTKLRLNLFVPEERAINRRIAEFLAWAREKYPHQLLTYEEITMAIFSLDRIPPSGSPNLKSVRNQMQSAKVVLHEKYGSTIHVVRGVGARATVDDVDVMEHALPKDLARHKQTAESLKKTATLINPARLKEQLEDLGGDPEHKANLMQAAEWLDEYFWKYLKSLDRPTVKGALAPPPQA